MKKRYGCLRSILIIAGVIAFSLGLEQVGDRIDRARFPWGYRDSGRAALAGTWVGPVTMGSGKHLALLIDMQLAPLDRGRRRARIIRTGRNRWLEGRALLCEGPGRV